MKQQLITEIAKKLKSFGYKVYVSKDGRYGFYTDGVKVVSFGGTWESSVDFSGKYSSQRCGTGWKLDGGQMLCDIDAQTAAKFIAEYAPRWATQGEIVNYTTPEQHLKIYGVSSGYKEF